MVICWLLELLALSLGQVGKIHRTVGSAEKDPMHSVDLTFEFLQHLSEIKSSTCCINLVSRQDMQFSHDSGIDVQLHLFNELMVESAVTTFVNFVRRKPVSYQDSTCW